MHKFNLRTGYGVFQVLMSREGQVPTSPLELVRKLVSDEADRLLAESSLTSLPIEEVCTSVASRGDAMTETFEMRLAPDANSVLFEKVDTPSERGVWATWSDLEAALQGKDFSVDILDR